MINVANVMVVFPMCFVVKQLNLDYLGLRWGHPQHSPAGHPSVTHIHTHTHCTDIHTHFLSSPLACGLSSHTLSPVWWCHQGFNEGLLWHHWDYCQAKPISFTMCLRCASNVCMSMCDLQEPIEETVQSTRFSMQLSSILSFLNLCVTLETVSVCDGHN